jgi:ABC-type multidrug transport system fused ATPase/permease subunit
MRSGLAEIYRHLSTARRRQFLLLIGLMIAGAVLELGTIGSIIPFLSVLTDPQAIARLPAPAARLIGASSDPLVIAAILFAAFVMISGAVRLQLARSTQDFAFGLNHELLLDVQRRFLWQPYRFHTERNTSTLLAVLEKVELLVFEVIMPLMQAFISAFIAVFILAALLYIDAFTALVAGAAFAIVYLGVSAIARKRLAKNSEITTRGYNQRIKIIQESLGGIRDVIIDGSQSTYLAILERANAMLSGARADTVFISLAPHYIIQSVGMVILAAVAVAVAERGTAFASVVPTLGAIALGAQRLLPLLQQVYSGFSTSSGYRGIFGEVVESLQLPIELPSGAQAKPITLKRKISVENLGFTYSGRRNPTLTALSFDIPKGTSVALIGETGSGKSTLADLLMGLIEPDEGRICIDGEPLSRKTRRQWQRNIAHVPQSIFLADASIERNIALSLPDETPDRDRVIEATKKAQLHEFVASLPAGYDTHVGERGIRLSGGQRQRLGIARAIYKDAPVLVLDEATSALDYDTEAAVVEALTALQREGRTIIIVAHRLSTVEHCDLIARLDHGRLVELGGFDEVLGTRAKRS